jgi:hypothetical protein
MMQLSDPTIGQHKQKPIPKVETHAASPWVASLVDWKEEELGHQIHPSGIAHAQISMGVNVSDDKWWFKHAALDGCPPEREQFVVLFYDEPRE